MRTKDKIFAIGFILLIATILVAGCSSTGTRSIGVSDFNAVDPSDACPVTDYGNGVTFVGCTEGAFASYLSDYIEKNDVVITSISGVPTIGAYNGYYGYIVVSVPSTNVTINHRRLA